MLSLSVNSVSKFSKPVFNPKAIPGIIHWWKWNEGIQDGEGDFPDDNEGVWKWIDAVGSATVLIDDAGLRPVYNLSEKSVDFNGAFRLLQIQDDGEIELQTGLDGFALYFRIKYGIAPDGTDNFVKASDSDNFFIRAQDATTVRVKSGTAGSGGRYDFTVPTIGTSKYYNIGIELDAEGGLHCYVDGVESTTGELEYADSSFTFDILKGGRNDNFRTGLIFESSLNDRDRRDLQDWLTYRN